MLPIGSVWYIRDDLFSKGRTSGVVLWLVVMVLLMKCHCHMSQDRYSLATTWVTPIFLDYEIYQGFKPVSILPVLSGSIVHLPLILFFLIFLLVICVYVCMCWSGHECMCFSVPRDSRRVITSSQARVTGIVSHLCMSTLWPVSYLSSPLNKWINNKYIDK